MNDKINRIYELVNYLKKACNYYYNLSNPIISDMEYDTLFDELQLLENETGYILSDSVTQNVGYEIISKLNKIEHPIQLKSLDKTKSMDELLKFINNKDIILMLKADGLTVELLYENGILVQASTRGNGIIGEDIFHNVKTFKNFPISIPYKGRVRIIGEAIINKKDFNKINSNLFEDEKYSTPRNLASGSVRQLNSEICHNRNIECFLFGILEIDNIIFKTKNEQLIWLGEQGFNIIYNILIINNGLTSKDLEFYITELKKISDENFIPIDGIVIQFNDLEYCKSLGETNHHPLHSIAFKFTDEAKSTILREVEWSVGRTGIITPIAIFDKVILDNTEVTRASIHNLSIIEELELGIEDSISIIKANQIIPQIEDNFTRSNNLIIPSICPICNEKLFINQNNSKFLYCINNNCPAKLLKRISHFVSRDALNIEGLSETTIEKFINMKIIKELIDVYKLQEYENIIKNIEGFGQKSYNNLINAIEKSKNVQMVNFIYALGIGQIGIGGAKRLVKHFNNNINEFINALESHYNFSIIEDIGTITNNSIYDWWYNTENRNMFFNLLNILTIIKKDGDNYKMENKLNGKIIVVTGTFKNYSRSEIKDKLEKLGSKVTNSISKKTDYLITGTDIGLNKYNDAIKFGTKIITEEEFEEILLE